ncbi:hypothetical protein MTYP_01676 [Methylophilaceae bacterium]|nr:hypothetical protein MTYP_01676 [Methylophilaceae bacterium]
MTVIEMAVVAWCLGVLVSDLARRRIPNLLSFGAIALAGGYLLVTGQAMLGADWQSALMGAGIALLLTVPAYLAGMLGAGDVKLLLAIGLIGGWYVTLYAFVVGALIAGAASVGYLLFIHYGGAAISAKKWMPFGSALSIGLLFAIGVDR